MRPAALLAACACLSAGLAACGGDEENAGAIPRTTPPITIPTGPVDAPTTNGDDQTETTATTDTAEAGAAEQPASGASGGAAAPAQPQQPAEAQQQGGGGAAAQPQQQGGGQQSSGGAEAGEFEDFCQQNPGAC